LQDLFPETWREEALRAELVPYAWPTFFAVYPVGQDLPRVAAWQGTLCREHGSSIVPRPQELLHVSIVECGRPKRKRQPLPEALAEAARHFSFAAFDLVFGSIARFGRDGRALAAIADAASQQKIRDLRVAIADAQRHAGLFVSRSAVEAHLTLGYGDGLPQERRSIPPFGFRVTAVELVASETGKSRHRQLQRWPLEESP
jgi:RNA 2',3'-cyclic 3'-phosphodiesterase